MPAHPTTWWQCVLDMGQWVWVVLQLQESCKFTSLGCKVHVEKTWKSNKQFKNLPLAPNNDLEGIEWFFVSHCRKSFSQTTKRLNTSLQVRWTSNKWPTSCRIKSKFKEKVSSWVVDPYYRYLVKKNMCVLWAVVCFSNTCLWLLMHFSLISSKPHISSSSTHPYINPLPGVLQAPTLQGSLGGNQHS